MKKTIYIITIIICFLSRGQSDVSNEKKLDWGDYYLMNKNYYKAIELYTNINPNELIAKLQLIEKRLKKNKLISNGPRRIDLDIIYYNKFVIRKDSLIIPHPRAHLRDFVLYPICEIIPFYIHPIIKKTTKHLISQLKKKYIFKIIKKQKGSELIF